MIDTQIIMEIMSLLTKDGQHAKNKVTIDEKLYG